MKTPCKIVILLFAISALSSCRKPDDGYDPEDYEPENASVQLAIDYSSCFFQKSSS